MTCHFARPVSPLPFQNIVYLCLTCNALYVIASALPIVPFRAKHSVIASVAWQSPGTDTL